MKTKILLINDFIAHLENFKDGALYSKSKKLNLSDNVLIAHEDRYLEAEEIDGFSYMLELSQVEDVISNLTAQIHHPTLKNIIEALNYYIENDAFIDAKKQSKNDG